MGYHHHGSRYRDRYVVKANARRRHWGCGGSPNPSFDAASFGDRLGQGKIRDVTRCGDDQVHLIMSRNHCRLTNRSTAFNFTPVLAVLSLFHPYIRSLTIKRKVLSVVSKS